MYFGSVRFFKNLILLCVLIFIFVPVTVAVCQRAQLTAAQEQVMQAQSEAEQAHTELAEANRQVAEAEARAAAVVAQAAEGTEEESFSAEVPSYQLLYPDFYAPERVTEQGYESGVMYLTFDDGPTKNTDTVLEVLAEKGVKATFFVTGHNDEASKERMRQIVAQGHTLGMHTYCHAYETIYDSVEAYLDDMYQIFALIREATGETPAVFRFAGGSINSHNYGIYRELIAEMLRRGFIPYDWNISAQDATSKKLSVDTVIQNVLNSAAGKDRGIVLMHDGYYQETTAQALGTIIDRLQERGYTFDRIVPETKPVLFGYLE